MVFRADPRGKEDLQGRNAGVKFGLTTRSSGPINRFAIDVAA